MTSLRWTSCLAAILLWPDAARGGGPLAYDTNGAPVTWDPAVPVSYATDLGGLGKFTNAEAVSLCDSLFARWTAVPTATFTLERAGDLGIDVDVSNFWSYLGPYAGYTTPMGRNAIVFDADGSIFDLLFGVGTGVLGFAGPTFMSDGTNVLAIGNVVPPGFRIIEGLAFFNGKFQDGINDPANDNPEISFRAFQSVFVHEMGHFAGLDHTQIHGMVAAPETDTGSRTSPVETMYPFLTVSQDQTSLERDDKVALSCLYPTADFLLTTGTIEGRVYTRDLQLLNGIDVIARNIANEADAVSYVSGATLQPPGRFQLRGLTPGAKYKVQVQEIDVYSRGGSSVGPFDLPITMPGPPEYFSGPTESAHPGDDPAAFAAITAVAGTLSGVDIVLNRQRFEPINHPVAQSGFFETFATGDFDRDGKVDLVAGVTANGTNVIDWFRGRGDGTFDPAVEIDAFAGCKFIVAAQLNPAVDGLLDLAVGSSTLGDVQVYLGHGDGTFAPGVRVLDAPDISSSHLLTCLLVGRLDLDATDDLLTLVYDYVSNTSVVYSLLDRGTGGFDVVSTPVPALQVVRALAPLAGGPGDDAVGIVGQQDLAVLVGLGDGSFTPTTHSLSAFTNRVSDLVAADLNHDGFTDLAMTEYFPVGGRPNFTRSFVDLVLGDGSGGFTFASRFQVPEPIQEGLATGDFDRDGHIDVATAGAASGLGLPGAEVVIGFGDGAGGTRQVESIWGLTEFPYRALAAADFDGDGWTDLIVNKIISALLGAQASDASVLLNRNAPVLAAPPSVVESELALSAGPNPTPGAMRFSVLLPAPGRVRLDVVDVTGRRTRTLVDGALGAGLHAVAWDGRRDDGTRLAAGVYFATLQVGSTRIARRIVVLP